MLHVAQRRESEKGRKGRERYLGDMRDGLPDWSRRRQHICSRDSETESRNRENASDPDCKRGRKKRERERAKEEEAGDEDRMRNAASESQRCCLTFSSSQQLNALSLSPLRPRTQNASRVDKSGSWTGDRSCCSAAAAASEETDNVRTMTENETTLSSNATLSWLQEQAGNACTSPGHRISISRREREEEIWCVCDCA